ncbi:MAG TPA: DUF5991 domain-containing protein [Cellvibrio sp.]|nr:DUF5991 domain-containing protein [Cellvibrio sp.]
MKNFFKTNILLILASSTVYAQTPQWNGIYEYEALLGENAAEDKIIIQYQLILTKDNCKVTAEGYQTDEKIICTSENQGKDLIIKFKSYEDGSTKNAYGVSVYGPDSTLFKLSYTKDTIKTTWEALSPGESYSAGTYFEKIK